MFYVSVLSDMLMSQRSSLSTNVQALIKSATHRMLIFLIATIIIFFIFFRKER